MNKSVQDSNWDQIETYKSMIAYASGMLRFIFLVNGGGIIAILTFVGNSEKCGARINLGQAIGSYLVGLFFAGLATGTAYWTQFTLLNEQQGRYDGKGWHNHMRWVWISFAVMALSLISFAVGSVAAMNALQ